MSGEAFRSSQREFRRDFRKERISEWPAMFAVPASFALGFYLVFRVLNNSIGSDAIPKENLRLKQANESKKDDSKKESKKV
jgi:hypothetical protein